MNKKILVTFIRTFLWAITAFCLAYSIKNNYFLGIFLSVSVLLLEAKRLLKQIETQRMLNLKVYRWILKDYYLLKFIKYSGELEDEDEEFKKKFIELAENVELHANVLLEQGIFGKKRKEILKMILKEVKKLKE